MKIALTFDDGPNDPHTLNLLAVLAKYDVKATFFMVGKFIHELTEIARQVKREGHWLGNHTFTHPKLTECSLDWVAREIEECQRALYGLVGPHSNMFRPPFILTSPAIEEVVVAHGLQTILFQAAAGDGGPVQSADAFVEKVTRELKDESGIILMHDGSHLGIGGDRRETVKAADRLIAHYKSLGAEFVSPLEI